MRKSHVADPPAADATRADHDVFTATAPSHSTAEPGWFEIERYALSVDGYRAAGGFEACAALANSMLESGVAGIATRPTEQIRCALFFEQRRWRHYGEAPDAEAMKYIRALVEVLRGRNDAPPPPAPTVTAGRAWGIKLGSAGICVPFCERHGIVGVGWKDVDPKVLATADRDALWEHVNQACAWYKGDRRGVGSATGQLYRFAHECRVGDYVLYYDPPRKHVRIGRVTSELLFREFEAKDDIDIWHYRRVDLAPQAFNILDFHGGIKGSLLGPRMSFWEIADGFDIASRLYNGRTTHDLSAADVELQRAYAALRDLVVKRAEALNAEDWESLVADYFRAQGAHVNEREVGKSRAIIDVEARFDLGELGYEVVRVQVKRLKNQKVDWDTIEKDFRHAGETRFCFVSVFGFTDEARERAQAEKVILLEAGDFTRFMLSGKMRAKLREKLRLPAVV